MLNQGRKSLNTKLPSIHGFIGIETPLFPTAFLRSPLRRITFHHKLHREMCNHSKKPRTQSPKISFIIFIIVTFESLSFRRFINFLD